MRVVNASQAPKWLNSTWRYGESNKSGALTIACKLFCCGFNLLGRLSYVNCGLNLLQDERLRDDLVLNVFQVNLDLFRRRRRRRVLLLLLRRLLRELVRHLQAIPSRSNFHDASDTFIPTYLYTGPSAEVAFFGTRSPIVNLPISKTCRGHVS